MDRNEGRLLVPRLRGSLIILSALAIFAAVAPAYAAWEAPIQLDQEGETFGNSGEGEIVTGTNGLATVLFQQGGETGGFFGRRRAADAADWSSPQATEGERLGLSSPLWLAANPAGAVAGGFLEVKGRKTPGVDVDPIDEYFAHALGWPLGGEPEQRIVDTQNPDTETGEDDSIGNSGTAPQIRTSPVEVAADGRDRGYLAFLYRQENVQDSPNPSGDVQVRVWRFPMDDPRTGGAFLEGAENEPRTVPGGNQTVQNSQRFDVAPKYPTPPPADTEQPHKRPRKQPGNPQIAANSSGQLIVTFTARPSPSSDQCREPESPNCEKQVLFAARYPNPKAKSTDSALVRNRFGEPQQISPEAETNDVTDHDVVMDEKGNATIAFAADPTGTRNRIYARRWLSINGKVQDGPRAAEHTELVSSSASTAAAASAPRLAVTETGRVTAAWIQGGKELHSAERSTSWTVPEQLSAATRADVFDLAADSAGIATVVYGEGTNVRARRRDPGKTWASAATLNTSPVDADRAPEVAAGLARQADVYFVQADGSRDAATAVRWTGEIVEETPPARVLPPSDGCPGDLNVIFGDDSNNSLNGTDGRDTMLGGGGDDTIFGAAGDDCLRGQAGNDTVAGDAGDDDVGGGDGDDRVTGGDGADTLYGGEGADSMNGNAGDDTAGGGGGNDIIYGATGNDTLDGEDGDDKLRAGGDDDIASGAAGNDRVFGHGGRDNLSGGVGDDRLSGGADADSLLGEDGNDKLVGGGANDTLDGGTGDDGIRGGTGSDAALGGLGADTLFGHSGDDVLSGGDDNDKAYGGSGHDRLLGEAGDDRLRGGNGADRLFGAAGKDKLFGDNGKDRLFGGADADVLTGGGSRDRVSGGGGNDRIFVVDNKRDTVNCGAGRDRVVADAVDRVNRNCERVSRRS